MEVCISYSPNVEISEKNSRSNISFLEIELKSSGLAETKVIKRDNFLALKK